MMDLSKSYEFFNPNKDTSKINIIGCGSVGSTVAENLVRCGITNLSLWDFDYVTPHNIANQIFRERDVGRRKTEALVDILSEINPEIKQTAEIHSGWGDEDECEGSQVMSGYLFLCVDSIELRKKIIERHKLSPFVKAVFDFRTSLTGAQHYAADWSRREMRENLLKSMQFTDEEAQAQTPVSACGVALGVATTVRIISALGVNNYINFVKGDGLKKLIIVDAFKFKLDAF